MRDRELVVVGGGPAGMAAALAARAAGVRDVLLLERDQHLGGILNQCIHPGFGLHHFKEELTGPEYADRFVRQVAEDPGIEVSLRSFVVKLTKDRELSFLRPGALEEVKARAVILATGCRERTREMIAIPGSRPAGVYPAGLAQKMVNMEGWIPGREAVIVGSGDIGLIMARRMALEGVKVRAVVEIQKTSRGLVRNVVQCLEDYGIPLHFQHRISRIHGRDRVEKVSVVKVDDDFKDIPASGFELPCDTVLVSVGLIPENELLEMAGAEMDRKTNGPVSDEVNLTSLPGIFACGNAFKVYDLADSVTRDSELAGRAAARYLEGK
ncbi:MAG: FAD-dependent oxidoreductase [Elusimicrobiales bacterium]|nr:FAD-dependent oxidoreductase [Elusimicrobiales bacterium]